MRTLLTIEDLKIVLKDEATGKTGWILRGIDLSLRPGETLAVVGESGCGKSMTALSILRLLPQPPMEWVGGKVIYKNRDLSELSVGEWKNIRGREIGIIFQEPFTSLNPVIPVGEQIEETLRIHQDPPPEVAREKVLALLREVGLADAERLYHQYPHQLSGGMCQRVMMALAVSCGPSLLIADEPTTALDVTVQAQILDLLFRMTREHHLAVLFITHDLRLARMRADRVAIFYAGQVVEEGTPEDIFSHPQHPYTEGLLAAMPELSQKGKRLLNIAGAVPSPFEDRQGCLFASRCPRVQEKCGREEPLLEAMGKGHQARCFYPSGK